MLFHISEKLVVRSRKMKFELFMKIISPKPEEKILDVGVNYRNDRCSNYLERWYPFKNKIVALAADEKNLFSDFKKNFPDVKLIFGDGRNLPFGDNAFDIVFSNAVLEHVGNYQEQKKFIDEICRVGRRIFITTPNRWFPVDFHTLIPLVHWLPQKIRSYIYQKMGKKFWANPNNLNLLGRRELLDLFPKNVKIKLISQRFLFFTIQFIVIGEK